MFECDAGGACYVMVFRIYEFIITIKPWKWVAYFSIFEKSYSPVVILCLPSYEKIIFLFMMFARIWLSVVASRMVVALAVRKECLNAFRKME